MPLGRQNIDLEDSLRRMMQGGLPTRASLRPAWITRPPQQPIITDLTGQDLWALARDGYEPCGFLFDFCRYHVWHVMKGGNWSRGGELDAATNAVEKARHLVASRVIAQA